MFNNKNFNCFFRLPVVWLFGCFISSNSILAQSFSDNKKGLHFTSLPNRWDEAVPLGNGTLGALIYEKDGKLRIALDRADLWDLRPVDSYNSPAFSYNWIYEQVLKKDYAPVQVFLNTPDIQGVAPTKIPAGALEFPIRNLGKIDFVSLDIATATCYIAWINGAKAMFFISATESMGYFRFENLPDSTANKSIQQIQLEPPPYQNSENDSIGTRTAGGQDVALIGYPRGITRQSHNLIHYHQQGWKDFSYDIAVTWKHRNRNTLEGTWSITSHGSPYSTLKEADKMVLAASKKSLDMAWNGHKKWWKAYWEKSSIELPDSILMHQYDMGMYLFASASRKGAPPISLQAVWTADNGKLPPWRGDFHNDLNTQLSYWPGYASNHLEESSVFTDWLWKIKPAAKKYTQHVFKDSGLNVPGVCTLGGQPMGRWAQYSFSPTASCWLAQYFYWQWIYSGDEFFLKQYAYPWVKEVATHIQSIAVKDENHQWKLPISSSPEFFDGNLKAWFLHTSNFELSLIQWLLQTAIKMADTLHLQKEAAHWRQFFSGWPQLAVNAKDSALLVAPGISYSFSHRHFSHLLGIYPLQLTDWFNGAKDRKIINASLDELKEYGPSGWKGYSYAWEACLKAMSQDGDGAAKALRIFAIAFCSPNSFHLNGDNSGKGFANSSGRPFTLEGNFAYARGIQLMLLQQHNGVNYIFPAIPGSWQNVSFQKLRTPGAFLVSAKKEKGLIDQVKVFSEKGGVFLLKMPFKTFHIAGADKKYSFNKEKDVLEIKMKPGEEITVKNGDPLY